MWNNSPLRRAWVPALLWLAVIVLESAGGSAENTGKILLPVLRFLFGPISYLRFLQIHYCLRKAGHFVGYAVLSVVMFRAWWATVDLRGGSSTLPQWRDMLRDWSARAAGLAALSTVAVAVLDEWHQAFAPGRGSSGRDVLLDTFAGLFTQMLLIVFSSVRSAPTKKHLVISS